MGLTEKLSNVLQINLAFLIASHLLALFLFHRFTKNSQRPRFSADFREVKRLGTSF